MRLKYILIFFIILLSISALILRGSISEKTYAYLEIPASNAQITIISYALNNQSVKVYNISEDAVFISNDKPFQAVIINLPYQYKSIGSHINWVSITYILTSNSEFEYTMLLFLKNGKLSLNAKGPIFLSHKETFVDIYRLDATNEAIPNLKEISLLYPFINNFSIVIIKKGFDSNGFLKFKLISIEIMYTNESIRSNIILDYGQITSIILFMIAIAIIFPIILWALFTFWLKPNSMISKNFFLTFLFIYGIISRIILAPFTGHPYDMEVWIQITRLFYESGIINIKLSPMPLTYYLLLLAYSPFAILKNLGLKDTFFLFHKFGMIEAIFIKAPFILSDIIILYFLLKIFNKVNNRFDQYEKFTYAFIYFLNPLAIILSSIWGMCDSIAIALFLAGIYYTLFEKRIFYGAFFYTLSGLIKGFGFIGIISIAIVLIKEKKVLKLFTILSIISIIIILFYSQLIIITGIQAIPELFIQFFRGRAGIGSKLPYIAAASYISYLSILGFNIEPSYLTYLFIIFFTIISIYYFSKIGKFMNKAYIKLTLQYFAIVFLIFYLTFFRVYEQYYLWIIPILIIYSYLIEAPKYRSIALCISLASSPILLFGTFLTGIEYYWIPLNLPIDASIVATLPSILVALCLINIADLKGPLEILKTNRCMLFLICLTLWLSYSFAYYIYYKVFLLGVLFFLTLLIIFLIILFFLYKKLKTNALIFNLNIKRKIKAIFMK
jgi:hypothetical protein